MARCTAVQYNSLHNAKGILQVVEWIIPCFLVGMLIVDKLFINIKCNNPYLWFLFSANLRNFWTKLNEDQWAVPKWKHSWTQNHIVGQKHRVVFSRNISAKISLSLLYNLLFEFGLYFFFFFLFSNVSEQQSFGMEGSLVCPFLNSSI